MGKWVYFKDSEIVGLREDVVFKLERARQLFDAPILITSGYRDPSKNDEVGGVKDSAHESGLAVDIRCADQEMQKRLIWALCVAGFRRVGAYDKHVHVDTDDGAKPSPAFWIGQSK